MLSTFLFTSLIFYLFSSSSTFTSSRCLLRFQKITFHLIIKRAKNSYKIGFLEKKKLKEKMEKITVKAPNCCIVVVMGEGWEWHWEGIVRIRISSFKEGLTRRKYFKDKFSHTTMYDIQLPNSTLLEIHKTIS